MIALRPLLDPTHGKQITFTYLGLRFADLRFVRTYLVEPSYKNKIRLNKGYAQNNTTKYKIFMIQEHRQSNQYLTLYSTYY